MSGEQAVTTNDVMEVAISSIVADQAFNVRKNGEVVAGQKTLTPDDSARELALQIKKDGQLQPVLVEKRKDGKFFLIFGFQRFRAIGGSEKDGFLGRKTILARVVEPMSEVDRMYLNIVENVARANISAYDLAIRVNEMSLKHGQGGQKIANRLGKSVGYINNLIRVRQGCCKAILDRWAKEQAPGWKEGRVCSVDQLVKWSKFSEEQQIVELNRALGIEPDKTDASGGGESETSGEASTSVKRAKLTDLKKALAAVTSKLTEAKEIAAAAKDGKDDVKAAKYERSALKYQGMQAALHFAMGTKGYITGVYTPEEKGAEEGDDGN